MLTFGDAKAILAKYTSVGGYCPTSDDPQVNQFVIQTLQYLLYSSANADLRRFDFCAHKGVFTVPEEVESIQKVKINGSVGNVWDRWFSYHNENYLDDEVHCLAPGNAIFEDPNYYSTAYDVPQQGTKVGILGHCEEDSDSHVIIQGQDSTGREIFTQHKGESISGEYLTIKKNVLVTSTVKFAKITNVLKTKTKSYATLYWVTDNDRGFLSDYTPLEENPTYRRYRLTTPNCGPFVQVSILARIRLKNAYADSDKIPFENRLAIETAGQGINASFNNDMQTAGAKDQFMNSLIDREQQHKRVQSGQSINVSQVTAPGRIINIVNPGGFGGFGWWGRR